MNDEPQEFVTVSAAAKHLGVAERTAHRYAARLTPGDRQVSDGGGPRLVRLSAMVYEAKEAAARNSVSGGVRHHDSIDTRVSEADVGDGVAGLKGSITASAPSVTATVETTQAAMIAQLQAENARLWGTVEQLNTNVGALTSELSKANERAAFLLAAVGSGRIQIAAQEAEPAQQADAAESAYEATNDDLRADNNSGGQINQAEKHIPFWQFWRR